MYLQRHKKNWYFSFAAAAILVIFALAGCGRADYASPQVLPAPAVAGDMTLYWGVEVKDRALAMIAASRTFCHFSVYELGDFDILNALVAAKKRGVDVQVVVDATEGQSQSVAAPMLKAAGINVRPLKIPAGISHIKLLVVGTADGLEALIGGMNFGKESMMNHDASVDFKHAGSGFEDVFQRDYANALGMDRPAPVYPYPLLIDRHIETAMLQAIAGARQSIAIEAFALTSKPFINALIAAKTRGVEVRVALDPHSSYQKKTARELARAGIDTCFYNPLQDELLHAKIMSIDHGKIFFIGSANFSRHAFTVNHEGDVRLFQVDSFGASVERDITTMMAENGAEG